MTRSRTFRACALAIACALSMTSHAIADTPKTIKVLAGNLADALETLAAQCGVDVIYPSSQLNGLTTKGVSGVLETRAAFQELLRGTGLVIKEEGGSVLVTLPTVEPVKTTAWLSETQGMRLAQAEYPRSSESPILREGKKSAEGTSAIPAEQEVVVTGTLLKPSGFTTPTPVTVIGEDLIAQRAPNDPGELLREIPSLKISSGSAVTTVGQRNSVGQSFVDFYGLTTARTLVLVDGVRQMASTAVGSVDVNVIPTFMIERVDTITGGASATYGADAVAGVANFVLRNRIDGLKVNAGGGVSEHGDKQATNLNLGFGTDIGNRTNLVVGVDLSRDTGIDSPYERDWGREESGLFSYGNASAARGAQPARLWVNNYEQKTATPGGIITGCTPSPCPASLANIAFDSNGNSYTFLPGTTTPTSTVMYDSTSNYGNSPNGTVSLTAPYKRWTGMAKATIDLTDDTQLRLTAGYAGTSGEERIDIVQSSGTNAATVTNTNPFLPANILAAMNAAGVTTIRVGRSNFDLGYGYAGQVNRLIQGGAQLSGKIAGSWSYDAYYKTSQANTESTATGVRTADIAAAFSNCTVMTTNGIRATAGCVGYDIFGQGQASQEALDYLRQYTSSLDLDIKQNTVQGLVRGVPFSTWAGEVNVGFGAQYRKDSTSRTLTGDSLAFSTNGFSTGFALANYAAFAADRSVKEYFGEANVPLVKDAPFLQALSVNLGYRYLDYSDNGGWNAWKAGLIWDLSDQVRLRFVRSRDIRSPSLFAQYATSATTFQTGVTDPRTNQLVNNGNPVPFFTAPNPNLRPEVSNTTTAGIVLQPQWVSGFRISADYFRFKIEDVIVQPYQQQVVNGCLRDGVADLCDFITFDSAGVVTGLALPSFNFNQLDVSGYNAEFAYKLPVELLSGDWEVRGLATYMQKYETTDSFAGTVFDDVGTEQAGQPRLQTNLLVTYKHGAFSTTASWRYLHGLKYSSSNNGIFVGPDDLLYFSTVNSTTTAPCPNGAATCLWYQTATNSISQNKFAGVGYVNWSAQYDIGGSRWKELQVYAKVDNLLDKDPPAYAYAGFRQSSVYDFVGRYYKVGFRASF